MTAGHEETSAAAAAGTHAGAGSKSLTRSGERVRPRSKGDRDLSERRLRARAAGFVVLMLAGVLIAGAVVRSAPLRPVGAAPSGQLPSVSLTSHSSVEWDCPGPLPAGASSERSAVVVANPARGRARVLVDVVAVTATRGAVGAPLPSSSSWLELAPYSERVLTLPTSGPARNDAVSVLSTAGAVAVFESVSPAAVAVTRPHHKTSPSAPEQSPCSTGAATTLYIASGSTVGESDIIVSLFDPTATQAVAGVEVSTQSGSVAPPALQGLIVRPYSVQVFDIGRSVVQQPIVAITVTTTAGSVAVGASETFASDVTASTSASGRALVIGIGRAQDRWVFTPGLGATSRTVGLRLYDPGSRAASVTISSPVTGEPPIEITEEVPAGDVRGVQLPLPVAALPRAQRTSRTPRVPPAVEGPIVVQTAEGVGIVVSRIAVLTVEAHEETVAFAAVTSMPSIGWVVPALASGESVAGGIVISNPGFEPVEDEIVGLTARGGRASVIEVSRLTVAPGASTTAPVSLPASPAVFSGLLVTASAPVVVEQDLYAVSTPHEVVPISPVPVEGVPVVG
jgi:hypothetical protein